MDDFDVSLIAALRHDARRPISSLALDLGVSRATVRARIDKLVACGEILGFTVVLRSEQRDHPVRAIMAISVEGKKTEPVIQRLIGMPEVRSVHSTNGRWDLVAEVVTPDLESFDGVLKRVRLVEGIANSETNLLLATRKAPRAGRDG